MVTPHTTYRSVDGWSFYETELLLSMVHVLDRHLLTSWTQFTVDPFNSYTNTNSHPNSMTHTLTITQTMNLTITNLIQNCPSP